MVWTFVTLCGYSDHEAMLDVQTTGTILVLLARATMVDSVKLSLQPRTNTNKIKHLTCEVWALCDPQQLSGPPGGWRPVRPADLRPPPPRVRVYLLNAFSV